MKKDGSEGSGVVGWLVLFGLIWYFAHNSDNPGTNGTSSPSNSTIPNINPLPNTNVPDADHSLSRDEAIEQHWDEIRDLLDGSEVVEACSLTNGNCYDLEADISSGQIETVHFLNGGWLNVSAEIDENGSASDSDQQGRLWDFTLDMDSSIVDDAVQQWAGLNGYTIQ